MGSETQAGAGKTGDTTAAVTLTHGQRTRARAAPVVDGVRGEVLARISALDVGSFKSLEEMVYLSLKREILDLGLVPGQLIKETMICEMFGVSRTPVRDALRLLQEQGFVQPAPYKGIYVTLLSLSNIKQMIYLRVAVETMVMRDFCRSATKMQMEEAKYMLQKQKAVLLDEGFAPEMFYRLDAAMHAVWFEATKKNRLWELIQEQQLHYTRFRMLDFVTETDFQRIIDEHEALLGMVEKRETARMEETLKDHLYYSMKRMRHQIDVEYRHYFEEEEAEGKFEI
ncbi:MAG: GntR family transcriptional regulator [Lachnospiraceae bacterium]|nr:GntR family transcriptional regulator [Lachnospiraceae bacterium]